MVCDILGLVSVGAYGYDLSAEFAVALESGHAGMEFLHAFAHGFGVDLDSFFIFDKMFENLIYDVPVLGIVVFSGTAGKISDHVIQVSENVEVVELLDVVVILGEVFSQGFFFGTALEERFVVRIFSSNHVLGCDDEIIFVIPAEDEILLNTALLKSHFKSEFDADLVFVFFSHAQKLIQI